MFDQVERVIVVADPGDVRGEQAAVPQQRATAGLAGQLREDERVVEIEPERDPGVVRG